MQSMNQTLLKVEGIVHQVDPINREIVALVKGALTTLYVPPDCKITLRGERIKFRLIQPRDGIWAECVRQASSLVALAMEVQTERLGASLKDAPLPLLTSTGR